MIHNIPLERVFLVLVIPLQTYASSIVLYGGSWAGEGNVYVSGYPVCDDYWDINDAQVVCNQLGYNGAQSATLYSQFGSVSDTFIYDDVACNG